MTDAATAAREQPLIAIDVVPMSFAPGGGLRVATARRPYEPYAGLEALPGVLLDGPERLDQGARRALRTKTGIDAAAVRHLAQIGAFDGPERDPRDAAISIAFLAVAAPTPAAQPAPATGTSGDGPRTTSATWHDVAEVPPHLPFDHDRIITAALDHVRTRMWRDLPLTRALLGEVFTTSDAARLHAAVTGAAADPGNLNRALRTNPALERTAAVGPTPGGRGGRPPATWAWRN
ncbi:NUDIX domain-containing protein [Curtobacterium sp. ISL-83]|uniref:NUDIX domain-containing protein n=1 Tax=Curtobacterium sp. ISL-83 TaxID=2819145 RepID=UPI001BEA3821|nr:NUDIX domain-containing protein [Curtobacterium sp. ISL-83]MBT2501886.1 NUDIX hydrolase [Curtobacterium sp. ISL-83]